MNEHIFLYCERGLDPSLWAEPLNAITNFVFMIAAAAAWAEWRDRPPYERSQPVLLLIILVFSIGVGSLLFHTFANQWSVLADVIPIGVFMVFYLGFAMVKFGGFGWRGTSAAIAVFIAAQQAAGQFRCYDGSISFFSGVARTAETVCINGSGEYLPALFALAALGAWLAGRRQPSGVYLLAAAGVFLASVTFRSLDFRLCDAVAVGGWRIGTHFLWHLLNAATLYLLLLAALRHKPAWRRETVLLSSAGGYGTGAGSGPRGKRPVIAQPPVRAPRAKVKAEIIPPRPGTAKRRSW